MPHEKAKAASKIMYQSKRERNDREIRENLARRSGGGLTSSESEPRRSLRRRNVRYNIDYDDFLEEDDEDEEEDERRREKKLKLVVKLNQGRDGTHLSPVDGVSRLEARDLHAPEYGSSASEGEEDEPERKPLKKRRIGGGEEEDEDDEYDDQIRGDENEDDDIDEERGGRKVGSKGSDSVPGTPSDRSSGLPLPDKKTLELILDKLQKKDTYGVYAEPVDPEELPDYHDVIDHPMDFATVRNKLANGSYSTLEQFESDVFLICSNAMQYNSPETIYHKQARSIQELAKKKFERVRNEVERSEKELKLEQSAKSNSYIKKQPPKKPFFRTLQEPIGSDFSSGATLAATGDVQNSSNPIQAVNYEVPSNIDGQVEGSSSLFDTTVQDKAEELFSGRGLLGKLGRKSSVLDDNRRATYNLSISPAPRSESIFSTFEDEIRQFVAVGLHAEYSYARSLARFAATLGPIAWKVASQRIEQAVPVGCKFGRGWVGEYEPLPTPVLIFENQNQKEPGLNNNLHSTSALRKDAKPSDTPLPKQEHSLSAPSTEVSGIARGSTLDGKSSFLKSSTPNPGPLQNLQTKHFTEVEKVKKQVELNSLPSPKQNKIDLGVEKQANSNATTSRSRDMSSVNLNLVQSLPYKLPGVNGVVTGGLPNGKFPSSCLSSPRAVLSSSSLPSQTAPVATSHGQDLGPSKPVQLMRMMSERAPKQENSSNQSSSDSPSALSSVPSAMRDDSNNAAALASRAWMSIGAGGFKQVRENSTPKSQISADSLYNPAREFHPQMTRAWGEFRAAGNQPQLERSNFPMQAFVSQGTLVPNEQQLQNRSMIYPQLVQADMSKFQLQSTWRALSPHNQPRKKQEMLPPDLNIGFQSPGSPVKQSSSVLVDSQQPDLALQL
uniref:Bromo domain-containing protein n=1 Tax=Cucumis sativus TaxID=3659 RepID=A0A0A0K3T1_CUCSA